MGLEAHTLYIHCNNVSYMIIWLTLWKGIVYFVHYEGGGLYLGWSIYENFSYLMLGAWLMMWSIFDHYEHVDAYTCFMCICTFLIFLVYPSNPPKINTNFIILQDGDFGRVRRERELVRAGFASAVPQWAVCCRGPIWNI